MEIPVDQGAIQQPLFDLETSGMFEKLLYFSPLPL
jgi:hypothetical protein